MKTDLTAERLRELLDYDPVTGLFTRRIRTSNRIHDGDLAGHVCRTHGYRLIGVESTSYRANRLAWLYMTGEWPKADIDHRNGIRSDDRFANLRDVSRSINLQNRRAAQSNNVSGLLGVAWDADRGKWQAHIKANGKKIGLGRFATRELAHAAYLAAKHQLHPGSTL